MKKIILTILVSFLSLSAFAERFVMVTHGEGKDPFWPVVQKGGEDAARHVGADFEYIFNPSGDLGDMAKSIAAAAATQPDQRCCCCWYSSYYYELRFRVFSFSWCINARWSA